MNKDNISKEIISVSKDTVYMDVIDQILAKLKDIEDLCKDHADLCAELFVNDVSFSHNYEDLAKMMGILNSLDSLIYPLSVKHALLAYNYGNKKNKDGEDDE